MSALRTVAGAAAAAVALTLSASAASACWSGCGYQTYVPPPVVQPSCGCCSCGYQTYAPTFSYMPYMQPAYHVDQGPSYDVPPPTAEEPVPEEYGYPRRPWMGGYGYRHHSGYRGYNGWGYRHGYGYRHRYAPWMRGYGPVRVRG